jgi:hypothetical protein
LAVLIFSLRKGALPTMSELEPAFKCGALEWSRHFDQSLSISTIPGHLVQDRHRSLGNSRFEFVSARRKAEVKLGLGLKLDLEVELRSVQCFPTRNPRRLEDRARGE